MTRPPEYISVTTAEEQAPGTPELSGYETHYFMLMDPVGWGLTQSGPQYVSLRWWPDDRARVVWKCPHSSLAGFT